MKKLIERISLFAMVAILLSSCAVTMPYAVTENPIGSKTGISETMIIFGIWTNPDYGIAQAAKRGKIKGGISTVDQKTTKYGPIFKLELIVTGEKE